MCRSAGWGHLPDRPRRTDLVDRVSIRSLISTPICRGSSHPRVTVGRRRAYLIRHRRRLRIPTPPLRGRNSRRAFWVSRKTRWISLPERKRGRTCSPPYRVRVFYSFASTLLFSREREYEDGWVRAHFPEETVIGSSRGIYLCSPPRPEAFFF
jgi:hypothetical protein